MTWRQHRTEAILASLILVGLSVAVGYSTWDIDQVRQSLGSSDQSTALVALSNRAGGAIAVISTFLLAVPLLVGTFVGAPMFSRDLEQGTYQLIWTQSVTRRKWLVATLLMVIVPAIAGAAIIAFLATRWIAAQGDLTNPWYYYDEQGFVFVAYVVFAIALGAVAGVVIRRVVPAMAVTSAAYVAIRAAIELFLRPNFISPDRISQSSAVPDGSWVLSTSYTDKSNNPVSSDRVAELMRGAGRLPGTVTDYLHSLGVQSWISYQPSERFWSFQVIEASIFAVLGVLVVCIGLFWIARRST